MLFWASSLSRFRDHTQLDTPLSVELLRMSDRSVAEALSDNTQHSQRTYVYDSGTIRNRNRRMIAAADTRLNSHGHWDRLWFNLPIIFPIMAFFCRFKVEEMWNTQMLPVWLKIMLHPDIKWQCSLVPKKCDNAEINKKDRKKMFS
jgi:hypothetical protein